MADPQYEQAVKASFIETPLRTVLMIDDQFPTYSDLFAGTDFPQRDRAAALYAAFRDDHHMIVDIENSVTDVNAGHFRKSDLVILDYHLIPNSQDNTRSVELIRSLAASNHFNTVVVYTSEPDQDAVWLDTMAGLAGGWHDVPNEVIGETLQYWEQLENKEELSQPPKEALLEFARRGSRKSMDKDTLNAAIAELVNDNAVPQMHAAKVLQHLIIQNLAQRAGQFTGHPSSGVVGDYRNGQRWLQTGNVFVVIMQKPQTDDHTAEAAAIMNSLELAFVDWRPNIVQILMSEIQNAVETEGIAGSDAILRQPDTQSALTYYLLQGLGEKFDVDDERAVGGPVSALVDKVVDSLRQRLSSYRPLLDLMETAVKGDLRGLEWTTNDWPAGKALVLKTSELARTADVQPDRLMFRLNHFLSTEGRGRPHLTTGTIFKRQDVEEYFVVVSPACDLVAGQTNDMQAWASAISPVRPVIAVKLQDSSTSKALEQANVGEHVFVYSSDGQPRAFKFLNGNGSQPSYEFFFVMNDGLLREDSGKRMFDGARLIRSEEAAPQVTPDGAPGMAPAQAAAPTSEWKLQNETFAVMEQLRAVNATHLLQLTGQHLSRVGMDFLKLPKE